MTDNVFTDEWQEFLKTVESLMLRGMDATAIQRATGFRMPVVQKAIKVIDADRKRDADREQKGRRT